MNTFENGLLKYLSEDQLNTIQSKRIGIGGAGGLGSNVAMMLVRSGFKKIDIVDKDVIDASNLNRQQYFIDEIGQPKVDITRKRLLDINPSLDLRVYHREWNEKEAEQLFFNCQFIVEAFDVADWKYRFVQYYQKRCDVIVSGNGMAGLLDKKPMMVKRLGNLFLVGDGQTNSHDGHPPMAPRVTQCAAMMAEIVLDVTLGLIKS